MSNQQSKQPVQQNQIHHDEEILVVRRSILFQNNAAWQGLNANIFDQFTQLIQTHAKFIPRSHAETNEVYKQIIPYMIFTVNHKYFVMQRKSTASEQRLANKYSLGIGGHVRKEDITSNDIFTWAQREFNEEVEYLGKLTISKIGILNDDSTPVNKVHLGVILLLHGDSDQIKIKDEHKSGQLLTKDECMQLLGNMENWSQTILLSPKIMV